MQVGNETLASGPGFRFVGVELGLPERSAVQAHFAPRLAKALATTQRLRGLPLPASLCALLWRSTVLPQALYGCEIRDVRPSDLSLLSAAGKQAIVHKSPLHLNVWRATATVSGLPSGESAIPDPLMTARLRQLTWLQLLGNLPSLLGVIHRQVACPADSWQEPCPALRSAL